MTAPRRRWSRFSLRTLFVVVTLLCVVTAWIGRNASWTLERDRLVSTFSGPPDDHDRRWLAGFLIGPRPRDAFYTWDLLATKDDLIRIRQAFPECTIIILADGGNDPCAYYEPPHPKKDPEGMDYVRCPFCFDPMLRTQEWIRTHSPNNTNGISTMICDDCRESLGPQERAVQESETQGPPQNP